MQWPVASGVTDWGTDWGREQMPPWHSDMGPFLEIGPPSASFAS